MRCQNVNLFLREPLVTRLKISVLILLCALFLISLTMAATTRLITGPHEKIQDAINDAQNGDTIQVQGPGPYEENLVIDDKYVTLVSTGPSAFTYIQESITIQGTGCLCVDGFIIRPDPPPSIIVVEPDGMNDTAQGSYIITWTDEDLDDNATISIYYDTDDSGENGTLIASGLAEDLDGAGDQYTWDISGLPEGNYYIYAVIDDGVNPPVVDYSDGVISIAKTGPDDIGYGLGFNEQEGGLVGRTVRIPGGNTIEYRTDLAFSSPNSHGLGFQAFYNSRSDYSGPLGHGWTHTYDVRLDPAFLFDGNTYLRITDRTGRARYFEEDIPGDYKGAFMELSHVVDDAGGFIWHRLDGTRYKFSSSGRLQWMEGPKGNRLTPAYDGLDRVHTITDDASARILTLGYDPASGLLVSITGPVTTAVASGTWVTYGHDANNNLTSVTYADGSGFTYSYTDPEDIHNLTQKKNIADHLLQTWAYDTSDRCTGNFSRDGNGVDIDYVSSTEVDVTDAYSTLRTYTIAKVNAGRRIIAMQGPANAPYSQSNAVRWGYDHKGTLIEVEYAGGTINQYHDQDNRGNPETVRLAAGTPAEREIAYTFHPDMNTPLTRTEAGVLGSGNKVTIWDYDDDYDAMPNEDPATLVSRIIEQGFTKDITVIPYEYITTITYNTKGQILSIDGPLPGTGDTSTFTYDAATGDLLTITRPLIGSTSFSSYDNAGQPGTITDPNSQAKSFTYDGRGRVTVTTNNADSSTNSTSWNTAGLPHITTDEDGVTRTFTYDATYGKLSRETDPDGNYILYAYDTQGNRTERSYHKPTDERTYRKLWTYQHPSMPGKLWKEISADGAFTEYGYDSEGNINSVTDPETHQTTYEYDPLNRLKTVTQPGSIITTYAYDSHSNLASITDAEAHQTTYEYDDMGRLVSTTSPDTGTSTHSYDAAGNPASKSDANGITVNYTHDLLNRLTALNFPDSAQDITYTYDAGTNGIGHRTGMTDPSGSTTFTYDNRGRLTGKTGTIDGHSYPLTRTYTPGSRISSMTYPSTRVINYTSGSCACRVETISTTYSGKTDILLSNLTYLPFGPAVSMSTGSRGNVNNSYNESYRNSGGNPGYANSYTRTLNANNILTAMQWTNDPSKDQTYTYDNLDRLTNATGPYGAISYTYDDVGNRQTRTVNGQTETYAYINGTNKLDEITGLNAKTFTHDSNGNITGLGNKSLFYNQNNRLIRVEQGAITLGEYTYNGLGQRVKKVVGSDTTIFLYDFDGNIIAEGDSTGSTSREYLYHGSNRLAMADVAAGTIYLYVNDSLGTPQLMTSASGASIVWEATYKGFGEIEVDPDSRVVNNFRFPGQYFDGETGMYYNYHRYYDPRIGRYLRSDPIGLEGGINIFSYALNSPCSFTDRKGLLCNCNSDCLSGSYAFTGTGYGGFLFVGGVTSKHLSFKCIDGSNSFRLTIQCINFGGGLGGGVQVPSGIVAGCSKEEVMSNISGWSVFANVFPPGIPTKPGFGIGGDVGTSPVVGSSPLPIASATVSPGYGLEVSAGGSYCWLLK